MNDDQGSRLAGCLLFGALLLLLPLGWFLFSAFAPQLLFHNVTRGIYGFRTLPPNVEASLIPDVFSLGQTRDDVHAAVAGSALVRWPLVDLPEVPGIIEGYNLDAGRDIACAYRLLVLLGYGEDGRLQSAVVRKQSGTCI